MLTLGEPLVPCRSPQVEPAPPRLPGARAVEIVLREDERLELEAVVRAGSSPQSLVKRARVVLLAAEGKDNREIGRLVGFSEKAVGKWRRRFHSGQLAALGDAPRSGRPSRYTPEQKARVLQKATQAPRDNGLPFSHWSSPDLAKLAKDSGITGAIHPTTVWRWLNGADLQPHRWRYWLKITDPDFEARMQDVTGLYSKALELAKQGIPVFCFDEKTNIQALEREAPDVAMKPGKPHRRDHRYKRRGTTTLLAVFQVATGKVWGRFLPRTAKAAASIIREASEGATVRGAPKIHFVMDQLSTHWHHEVCQVVAALSGIDYDPKKHRTGTQRKAFLADSSKRVVIHFTPKRASWLDQIEIWFSTLGRKLLNRASFTSVQELQCAIYAFMEHHNRLLARPYRWTYTGRPCKE
jgi:transposase